MSVGTFSASGKGLIRIGDFQCEAEWVQSGEQFISHGPPGGKFSNLQGGRKAISLAVRFSKPVAELKPLFDQARPPLPPELAVVLNDAMPVYLYPKRREQWSREPATGNIISLILGALDT